MPPTTPKRTPLVKISSLWSGDRFVALGYLWTHTGFVGDGKHATARQHRPESLALGRDGYGYIGDSQCRFTLETRVRFQPPVAP